MEMNVFAIRATRTLALARRWHCRSGRSTTGGRFATVLHDDENADEPARAVLSSRRSRRWSGAGSGHERALRGGTQRRGRATTAARMDLRLKREGAFPL